MATQEPQVFAPRLLLSIEQAAAALGISRRQFYDLMRDRDAGLLGVNIGRRRLITFHSLEAYVERLAAQAYQASLEGNGGGGDAA